MEVNAHSQLRHPNITQMLGIVSEPDFELGIVLKYEQYGDAFSFVNEFRVGWPWKVEMMYCTALGLNYLHTSDPPLIHGDIKILNVLIGDDFVPKLADFGLSKWRDYSSSRTRPHPQGTVTHIAPERFRNINAKRNEMSDVYSYAILVWELLTGSHPFAGSPDALIIEAVKSGSRPDESEIAADVPASVREVMEKCWADQPDKRLNSRAIVGSVEKLREEYKKGIDACRYKLRMEDSERSGVGGHFDGSCYRLPIQTVSRGSQNSPDVAIPQSSDRFDLLEPQQVVDSSPFNSNAPISSDSNSQYRYWIDNRPAQISNLPNAPGENLPHRLPDRFDSVRGRLSKIIVGQAARLPANTSSGGLPSPGNDANQISADARTVLNGTAITSTNVPTLTTAGADAASAPAGTDAELSPPAAAVAADRRISVDEDVNVSGSQIIVSAADGYPFEIERTKKSKQRKDEVLRSIGRPTNFRHNLHLSQDGSGVFYVSDRLVEVDRSFVVGNAQLDPSGQPVDSSTDAFEQVRMTRLRPTSPNSTVSHITVRFNAQTRRQQFDGDPTLHF